MNKILYLLGLTLIAESAFGYYDMMTQDRPYVNMPLTPAQAYGPCAEPAMPDYEVRRLYALRKQGRAHEMYKCNDQKCTR